MIFKRLLREAQFHGSNRLTERKYRVFWAMSLTILMWAAASIIAETISRFFDNPSYLTLTDSDQIAIKFPSVDICPEVEYPDYKLKEFLDTLKIPPSMNKSHIRSVLRQLAAFYSPDKIYSLDDLFMLEALLKYNTMDVGTASRRLTVSCEEALIRCRWRGEMMNCSELFTMELTAYGYCCVFNGRSLIQEMQKYGIHNMKAPPTFYTSYTSHTTGLMVAVNSSQQQADVDLTYTWVALVNAQTYVEAGVNGTPISAGMEHWVGHGSKSMLINEDARSLSQHLLGCRMSTEKLKYFPYYSKKYCLVECEIARTISRCQCVRLTHPRPPMIRHCTARDLSCVKYAAVPFDNDQCNCPPTCDTDIDNFGVQNYPLMEGSYSMDKFYEGLDFSKVSIVRAHVLHRNTVRYIRRSYFTSYDLFSQLGGVFNLFFGCSILTLLELLQLAWYGVRYCIDRKKKIRFPSLQPIKKKKNNGIKKILNKGQVFKVKK
ncbi:sodium channel protein Nach-like isoform X2 [Pectinophora gossypiella]|uniref:sodium channel protein Nach-like isoform X2 n=1 Tax=Pectinophora gossypiella TaxID=13191 RepID=UPI00214E8EEC|nr:sodium channel protein Nach-like isoform X2 [Pectinophora gossypiella]